MKNKCIVRITISIEIINLLLGNEFSIRNTLIKPSIGLKKHFFQNTLYLLLFVFGIVFMGMGSTTLSAQGNFPISIQVQLAPPFSPYISDYKNKAIVSFTNRTNTDLDIYLRGKIENDRGQYAQTPPTVYSNTSYHVPAHQTIVIQGFQIDENIFDLNNIQTNLYGDVYDKLFRFGKLPEGFYSFCIYAYTRNDAGEYKAVSNPEDATTCFHFSINYTQPPVILTPMEDQNILPSPNQDLNITWSPPIGNLGNSMLVYDLYMVKVLENQDPNTVMSHVIQYGTGTYFKQNNIQLTYYHFNKLTTYSLEKGSRYALMVQVRDINNQAVFENNGFSEVRTFTYGFTGDIIDISKTTPIESGNCSCTLDVASLSHSNNTDALKAGGVFKIADIEVRIGEINNTGNSASGSGTISMIGAPIQVNFSDIKVNNSGIAYEGIVNAKTSNGFDFLDNGGVPTISTSDYDSFMDRISQFNLDAIKNGAGLLLPFGLKQIGAPDEVNIGIVGLTINPAQATYDAVAVVQLADANNVLSLYAHNVCFSNSTLFCGEALFALAEDFDVPAIHLVFKGYESNSIPGTYFLLKNKGDKTFHIHATYSFPQGLIARPDGTPTVAVIDADAENWSDWIAAISMDPFIVPALPSVTYALTEASYDHSTLQNPPGMISGFSDPVLAQKNPQISTVLWQGFYLAKLTVTLPTLVKNIQNPESKLEISASNVIIDNQGVTGIIGAQNVLSLDDGSLDGWYCSVDAINIKMFNSSLIAGGMTGRLILPISDKQNPKNTILYDCTLSSEHDKSGLAFQFTARPKADLDFSAWWAHFNIGNLAIIVDNKENETFKARATLSGHISIEHKIKGMRVGLNLIEVQNLQLQTVEPYAKVESIVAGFSSPQHFMAGFPISIKNIKPKFLGLKAGMEIEFGIALCDISNKILPNASSTFFVSADILPGKRSFWQRADIELSQVCIEGDLAGVMHIKRSCVNFFRDDPVFGDGISGNINASFVGLDNVYIECKTLFGKKSFSYWYFDVFGHLPPGIAPPIAPGLVLNGIGGGAWYNLAKTAQNDIKPEEYFNDPTKYVLGAYKPSSGAMGVKLMVGIGSQDGYLFNGIGTLGATIKDEGLYALEGSADIELFKYPGSDRLTNDPNAPVQVHLDWTIGIVDQVFSLNGAISINYFNLLKGFGNLAMLADARNQNYYLKIGEPFPVPKNMQDYGNRIHLDMTDPLGLFSLAMRAYFMAGNNISTAIPPPDPSIVDVSKLVGYSKLNYNAEKGGIVMGASAAMEYNFRFLALYFNARGGIGFDLALLHGVTCAGGGEAAGMNGWYASGQMYAGLGGEFGIFVNILGKTCKVPALSLRAEVLAQGGLPDPIWLKGAVFAHINVLAGAIDKDVSFTLSIGKECRVNTNILDLPLVKEVKPANGTIEVPINAYPEILFNYPVEQEFSIAHPESGRELKLKIQIDKLRVTNLDKGEVYTDYTYSDSYPVFSNNHRKLMLTPEAAFSPQTNYQIQMAASAQIEQSGLWTPLLDEHNIPVVCDSISLFRTGDCKPDELISDSNTRLGTFPFHSQRYFLQGESHKGAIILSRDFQCTKTIQEKYKLFAKFTPLKNRQELQSSYMPITTGSGHYLYFDIPNLPNDCIVRVEIIKRKQFSKYDKYQLYKGSPAQLNRMLHNSPSPIFQTDGNTYNKFQKINVNALENQYLKSAVKFNQKLNLGDKELDIVLYKYHFKTSRFNTLSSKLAGAHFNKLVGYFWGCPISEIIVSERFDSYDVLGFTSQSYQGSAIYYTMPLVNIKESNDYNDWMRYHAIPIVYKPFRDNYIDLDRARIKNGLSPRQIQMEGIGCNYSNNIYCAPSRPISLDGFDPPLSTAEIKTAEPIYFHGINVTGIKVVKNPINRNIDLLINH